MNLISSVSFVGSLVLFAGPALSQQPMLTVTGAANQMLGNTVISIGDLDGDSIPDFVTGSELTTGSGKVEAISGASGSVLYAKNPDNTGDNLGFSIVSLGDVDSDGVQDFAAMAATYVRVYSGVYSAGSGGTPIRTFTFASGLTSIGAADVNGNGVKELIVGRSGDVYAYEITSGTLLRTWTCPPSSNDCAGFALSVTGIGDWNGDGKEDVAFAQGNTNILVAVVSGVNQGALTDSGVVIAYACLGGTLTTHSNGYLTCAGGDSIYQTFSMGDLNGDGRPELGMRGTASFIRIVTYNGSSLTTFRDLPIPEFDSPSSFRAQGPIADLDGDEVPDLAIGKPWGGTPTDTVFFLSTETGDEITRIVSPNFQDRLGTSVADIGDVDLDGLHDIAIGAPYYNYSSGSPTSSGRVGVFSGKSLDISSGGFHRTGSAVVPY